MCERFFNLRIAVRVRQLAAQGRVLRCLIATPGGSIFVAVGSVRWSRVFGRYSESIGLNSLSRCSAPRLWNTQFGSARLA
jgi:hypothetical protein